MEMVASPQYHRSSSFYFSSIALTGYWRMDIVNHVARPR
jgi:hypothetical protein